MMNNLKYLTLGASSILTLLVMAHSASATTLPSAPQSCDPQPPNLQSLRPHNLSRGLLVAAADDSWVNFTAAESDAAVSLFGCDCPSCLQALQQLRTQPAASAGQGHCWANLRQENTPQQIQQVLQSLEENP